MILSLFGTYMVQNKQNNLEVDIDFRYFDIHLLCSTKPILQTFSKNRYDMLVYCTELAELKGGQIAQSLYTDTFLQPFLSVFAQKQSGNICGKKFVCCILYETKLKTSVGRPKYPIFV